MATFTQYDVVIAGASFGGVAAALAAAADPKVKVVLLEPSEWVGGQATSQGLTRWDETTAALTESTGSPQSYRDLRDLIRAHYVGKRSKMGLKQTFFNPGFAGVGPTFKDAKGHDIDGNPFAADPQVVRTVLTVLLKEAAVTVEFGATVTAVDVRDGTVRGVTVASKSGTDTYVGGVYLDATDLGDLLPLCEPSGLSWVIGAESEADTAEKQAESVAHPEWIQPITVPIALVWGLADDRANLIPEPPGYDDIRKRQGFGLFKVDRDGDIHDVFNPTSPSDTLWNYRQFIDPRNFNDGRLGRTTMNVGDNDYMARAIPTEPHSADEDAKVIAEARAVSVAFLYYLQNHVPRDDGKGTGYRNIKVDTDAFGTTDGTAPAPYIRESRRLANPWVRIVQSDIDAEHGLRAKNFPDSCGIGHYAMDVHVGWYADAGGKPENKPGAYKPNIGTEYRHIGTAPFQVPLGALLPQELNNFVAACKNIGATHLTSGAYRVHPIEWTIGEAAGVLAAYCTTQKIAPGDVWGSAGHVTAYQSRLLARGTPIFWWDDVKFVKGDEQATRAFAAIHLLGARGTFEGDGTSRNFIPAGDFTPGAREAVEKQLERTFDWPTRRLKRWEAAVFICNQLELPL